MRRRIRPILALVGALTTGCNTSGSAGDVNASRPLVRVRDCEGPARSLSPIIAALLPRRDGGMQPDDQWADLAKEVPGGFAGVILSNGQLVLFLRDTSTAAAAKRALAPRLRLYNFNVADAVVRPARWDFGQLVDWYNYLLIRMNFWWDIGLTSGDKDESLNRLHYGVEDEKSRERLVERLEAIGVPCDLIVIGIEGRMPPLTGLAVP